MHASYPANRTDIPHLLKVVYFFAMLVVVTIDLEHRPFFVGGRIMKSKYRGMLWTALRIIPALAMAIAIQSVNSTCFFCLHQPDVPNELKQTKVS